MTNESGRVRFRLCVTDPVLSLHLDIPEFLEGASRLAVVRLMADRQANSPTSSCTGCLNVRVIVWFQLMPAAPVFRQPESAAADEPSSEEGETDEGTDSEDEEPQPERKEQSKWTRWF